MNRQRIDKLLVTLRPSPWWGGWRRQALFALAYAAVLLHLSQARPPAGDDPTQYAYIGPGAGIALAGSIFAIFMAIVVAILSLLTLPIRMLWRAIRGRQHYAKARVKRVVVVGLDGLEPSLTEQMMEEGLLPNLKRLQEAGSYRRLGTTWPPLSPVAWSSFTTGSNPGKHNIFDFIDRTPSYAPTMSSVRLREAKPRKLLGIIPWGGGTDVVGMRKSKPFWTVLGEHGVFSSILRVPITYPPDKFNGVQLSAMCVPDLRGTLGLFTYYTDRGADADLSDGGEGGEQIVVQREGDEIRSYLRGPANPASEQHEELRIPFRVTIGGKNADATLHVDGEKTPLRVGKFSGFVSVTFNAGVGKKLNGIARFYLKSLRDPFELYCSPIQIDPDRPVLPISHPMVYSSYLARTQGPFYTLGLAEDTGALDRNVLDEDAFLQHCYDIHEEREKMFFDALAKTRRGAVVCVFDGPDRIQHMFWRFHDDQHPAVPDERRDSHRHVIRQMYQRMDELVGRVMQKLDPDTALFVMSDHGFKTFRRGVDLNAWLRDNGYLKLKDGRQVSEKSWLADIDWEHTRAFALGLAGIFINQKGRESKGIVAPGEETKKLVAELCEKLTGLKDPAFDRVAIREALPREKAYKGPYTQNAPDILVGYAENYRVSWDAAVGKASADVFSDNMKAWSGDHCVHPEIAPGVLFSNTRLREGEASIVDVGPTALDLFGIPTPRYMDGKSLLCTEAA